MFVFCTSCKGQNKTELPKDDIKPKTKDVTAADSIEITYKIDDWNKRWKIKDYKSTTKWYSETASQGVIIQNSFPKGGPYTDPTGKSFGQAIFWTRVINETATPLELTINFPPDSFAIPPLPDSYLKLFLPPDTMTLDKEGLYAFGATGLKSFLDTGLNKPTMLQRTINPKEECLFYIGALSYQSGGMVRAELVLKDQDLFYRISIIPHFDSALFPCGHIIFKK
jgi:hypothetical protein